MCVCVCVFVNECDCVCMPVVCTINVCIMGGVYPTRFLEISPLLMCVDFLSAQMDTGDPAFSDFMDNIMFRQDGSGKDDIVYMCVPSRCLTHICTCVCACVCSMGAWI